MKRRFSVGYCCIVFILSNPKKKTTYFDDFLINDFIQLIEDYPLT